MNDLDYINSMVWWIKPGQLGGMPMPYFDPERRLNQIGHLDAFKDDLPLLYQIGVRSVVCLLNLPKDETIYHQAVFGFHCSYVPDFKAPTMEQMKSIYHFIKQAPKALVVHCEGGIGRTGTILAAYLILEGESCNNAIDMVRKAEPTAIESQDQFSFLYECEKRKCEFRHD